MKVAQIRIEMHTCKLSRGEKVDVFNDFNIQMKHSSALGQERKGHLLQVKKFINYIFFEHWPQLNVQNVYFFRPAQVFQVPVFQCLAM